MQHTTRRVLTALLLTTTATAQIERYELGRRVRLFERAFAEADPKTRARLSVDHAKTAVTSFFALRLPSAGRALAAGRRALVGVEASDDQLYAEALYLIPDARLFDVSSQRIGFRIRAFYRGESDAPDGARIEVRLTRPRAGSKALARRVVELEDNRLDAHLDLAAPTPAGEYVLQATLLVGTARLPVAEVQVSFVPALGKRLESLADGLAKLPPTGSRHATVRLLHGQLVALTRRRALETDLPATRLLAQAEADLQAADQPLTRGPGQHWLSLACADPARAKPRRVVVRVEVPRGLRRDQPVPLVLALHGAGGTENLFFDGYGDGCIRPLARKRGWLLVAPRQSMRGAAPLPALIDELARLFPVDRQRVFLIGHSMGASAAVTAACRDPSRFAGVVAFGGGGRVRASKALTRIPFMIGIGDQDFARRSARGLRHTLQKAGVTVQFKEYADIEHLVIVQVGLPDAFEFLDGLAAPK